MSLRRSRRRSVLRCTVLRADDVPAGHAEIEALATLWEREAMLLGSALLVSWRQ